MPSFIDANNLQPFIDSELRDELKQKTPKSHAGNYTARFFQSLTADVGHPHLSAQLNQVIAIMRISDSWPEFMSNFNKMVARKNGQLELKFEDLQYTPDDDILPTNTNLSKFNKNLQTALEYNSKEEKPN